MVLLLLAIEGARGTLAGAASLHRVHITAATLCKALAPRNTGRPLPPQDAHGGRREPEGGPMRDFDDSTLWRISSYERMRAETGSSGYVVLERQTTLPTTLLAELSQLERVRREGDAVEVVAACMRQGESALLLLHHQGLVWPLTLFPRQHVYHLRRPIIETLQGPGQDLRVVGVEPPGLRPPGDPRHERVGDLASYRPLPPLLWALAMHAPHAELLADIAGRAAYRLAAGFDAGAGHVGGALGAALRRLHEESAALAEIARWPGLDRARATRLLNAVYLQGGLMVLRTHPQAREAASGMDRLRDWLRRPH
jgi:hypothetical protein